MTSDLRCRLIEEKRIPCGMLHCRPFWVRRVRCCRYLCVDCGTAAAALPLFMRRLRHCRHFCAAAMPLFVCCGTAADKSTLRVTFRLKLFVAVSILFETPRPGVVLAMSWQWVDDGPGWRWHDEGGWRYDKSPPYWSSGGGWVFVNPGGGACWREVPPKTSATSRSDWVQPPEKRPKFGWPKDGTTG